MPSSNVPRPVFSSPSVFNDAILRDPFWSGDGERFGASGPRLPEMAITPPSGKLEMISRTFMMIGRSMEYIVVGKQGSSINDNGTRNVPSAGYTVTAKIKGLTWANVTWNGLNPTAHVDPGGYAECRRIYPADVGMSSFQAGDILCWDEIVTLDSSSARFLVGSVYTRTGAAGENGFCAIYDTANRIDQLGTNGDMSTPTGGVLGNTFGAAGFDGETPGVGVPANNMASGPAYVIGRPLNRNEISTLLIGPSTPSMREDTRDPATVPFGTGFVDRAFYALQMVVQHCTRSGAECANLAANVDIDRMYRYADRLLHWIGANGMFAGATAAEELENARIVWRKFGKPDISVTVNVPRTTSSDGWTTDANQGGVSNAGPTGKYIALSRMLAAEGRAGRIKNVLPFPGLRDTADITHWLGQTPALTPDGLHVTADGAIVTGDDVEDMYGPTYSAWPDRQRQYAMSCVTRPPRNVADMVAAAQAQTDALGVRPLTAQWLNVPLNGDAGQIRRADVNGGFWPLSHRPTSEGSTAIEYSIYGTRRPASNGGYLRTLAVPDVHFPAGMTTSCAVIVDVADAADQTSIFSARDSASGDSFGYTPYSQGNALIRLNNTVSVAIPALRKPGLYIIVRDGNTIRLYRDGTLVGTGTANDEDLASTGISLFNQIGGLSLSRQGTRYFSIITHSLTDAQVAGMTTVAQTLIDWGVAQQVTSTWHRLADPYFEMIETLTGAAPTSGQQAWFNTYVLQALDTPGYLAQLDYLSLHHFIDVQVGLLNVVNPRSLSTVTGGVGSLTFTDKSGTMFSTNAIVSDVAPGYGATSQIERGLHMQQNSHALIWRGEVLGRSTLFCCGSAELGLGPRVTATDAVFARAATSTSDSVIPAGGILSGVADVAVERNNSANLQIFANGVQEASAARASAAFNSTSLILVGSRQGASVDTIQRTRWAMAGAALGSTAQAAIHTIMAAADAAMP